MTRVALRAQSIENHGESWRPDGLTWVGLEKAIRAFVAKTWRENKGLKHSRVFRRIVNFLLWLEKTKENPFFIVEIFLWFSRVRPYIASYLVWTKISKFSMLSGHRINFLLTGRENIWLSVMTHGPRCAPSLAGSPYVMTSSQILFYAFLLDHFHYFHTYLFSFREFLFSSIVAAKEHQDQVKSQ